MVLLFHAPFRTRHCSCKSRQGVISLSRESQPCDEAWSPQPDRAFPSCSFSKASSIDWLGLGNIDERSPVTPLPHKLPPNHRGFCWRRQHPFACRSQPSRAGDRQGTISPSEDLCFSVLSDRGGFFFIIFMLQSCVDVTSFWSSPNAVFLSLSFPSSFSHVSHPWSQIEFCCHGSTILARLPVGLSKALPPNWCPRMGAINTQWLVTVQDPAVLMYPGKTWMFPLHSHSERFWKPSQWTITTLKPGPYRVITLIGSTIINFWDTQPSPCDPTVKISRP